MKEKLLGLGVFVDNEYLDLYCSLIESNKQTKKEKFKTQQHHVIPCACFNSREDADKDPSNFKVNLLFKDHILAHYYLSLCAKESQFRYKMIAAIEFTLNKSMNRSNQAITEYMKEWLRNDDAFQAAYEEYAQIRYNRLRTPEATEKRIQALKGHSTSLETRLKISEANKGRHLSDETKAKMSVSLKGKEAWNKGKPANNRGKRRVYCPETLTAKYVSSEQLSSFLELGWLLGYPEEQKQKPPVHRRSIRCIETGTIYEMIKLAELDTGIGATSLLQCLKGRSKTAGGYHWEYVN